jgi:hypothetical protein
VVNAPAAEVYPVALLVADRPDGLGAACPGANPAADWGGNAPAAEVYPVALLVADRPDGLEVAYQGANPAADWEANAPVALPVVALPEAAFPAANLVVERGGNAPAVAVSPADNPVVGRVGNHDRGVVYPVALPVEATLVADWAVNDRGGDPPDSRVGVNPADWVASVPAAEVYPVALPVADRPDVPAEVSPEDNPAGDSNDRVAACPVVLPVEASLVEANPAAALPERHAHLPVRVLWAGLGQASLAVVDCQGVRPAQELVRQGGWAGLRRWARLHACLAAAARHAGRKVDPRLVRLKQSR